MTAWTPERVESLKAMWAEGHSCTQIAIKLKGCSRNAVIGKVHRLGLQGRQTVVRQVKRHPAYNRKETLRRVAYTSTAVPDPLMLPIEKLEGNHCRCPIGDPRQAGFGFCGHPPVPGFPYCAAHCAVLFNADLTKKSRRKQRRVPRPPVIQTEPVVESWERLLAA